MTAADLFELLRCPTTGQRLLAADVATLARANALADASSREHEENRSPAGAGVITAALVSADRKMLYPLRNGIPVLLTEAVVLL